MATDTLAPPADTRAPAAARARRRRRTREILVAYLLLGPNLLLFANGL